MPASENKVQFNLKNVHYAIMTETESKATWAAPVNVPGAVNLSLDQQGELSKFYADGIIYWQTSSNNGYEGDLEMALLPDKMLEDIWGMTKEETDNVIVENAFKQPKAFALLFQIDGDASERLYCLYNCTATRPEFLEQRLLTQKNLKQCRARFRRCHCLMGELWQRRQQIQLKK